MQAGDIAVVEHGELVQLVRYMRGVIEEYDAGELTRVRFAVNDSAHGGVKMTAGGGMWTTEFGRRANDAGW